jgi:hypothetical protein
VSRAKRHQVYDRIVQRLADHGWHDVRELDELTNYPKLWLDSLRRDPTFDVDEERGRLRLLRRHSAPAAT